MASNFSYKNRKENDIHLRSLEKAIGERTIGSGIKRLLSGRKRDSRETLSMNTYGA